MMTAQVKTAPNQNVARQVALAAIRATTLSTVAMTATVLAKANASTVNVLVKLAFQAYLSVSVQRVQAMGCALATVHVLRGHVIAILDTQVNSVS